MTDRRSDENKVRYSWRAKEGERKKSDKEGGERGRWPAREGVLLKASVALNGATGEGGTLGSARGQRSVTPGAH